jgi:hypothetical protein
VLPDGRWIAYLANAHLFKVAATGGQPIPLAALVEPYGIAWLTDGRIAVNDRGGGVVSVFSDQGGDPLLVTRLSGPSGAQGPPVLSGALARGWLAAQLGRQVSLVSLTDSVRSFMLAKSGALVRRNDTTRRGRRELTLAGAVYGFGPILVAGTHLVYAQSGSDGAVMATSFNTDHMRASGTAVQVLEHVRIDAGTPHYAVADDGTLAYVAGPNDARLSGSVRPREPSRGHATGSTS